MNIEEWWANIKNWMVWAETYLLWGMILVVVVLSLFFIWKGADDYRSFNQILQGQYIAEKNEPSVEVFTLKITGISSAGSETSYQYITLSGISKSASLDDRIAELDLSDGTEAIKGLEILPTFLLKEEHKAFWNTQFSLLFILKYGGWIAMCLFSGAFGYLNLKQNDKLLTKEIERLIQATFFLFLFGYIAYDFLNGRLVSFLNDELQFSASAGALSSNAMYFVVMALLLAYIIITKATPVQEEQDLTV